MLFNKDYAYIGAGGDAGYSSIVSMGCTMGTSNLYNSVFNSALRGSYSTWLRTQGTNQSGFSAQSRIIDSTGEAVYTSSYTSATNTIVIDTPSLQYNGNWGVEYFARKGSSTLKNTNAVYLTYTGYADWLLMLNIYTSTSGSGTTLANNINTGTSISTTVPSSTGVWRSYGSGFVPPSGTYIAEMVTLKGSFGETPYLSVTFDGGNTVMTSSKYGVSQKFEIEASQSSGNNFQTSYNSLPDSGNPYFGAVAIALWKK